MRSIEDVKNNSPERGPDGWSKKQSCNKKKGHEQSDRMSKQEPKRAGKQSLLSFLGLAVGPFSYPAFSLSHSFASSWSSKRSSFDSFGRVHFSIPFLVGHKDVSKSIYQPNDRWNQRPAKQKKKNALYRLSKVEFVNAEAAKKKSEQNRHGFILPLSYDFSFVYLPGAIGLFSGWLMLIRRRFASQFLLSSLIHLVLLIMVRCSFLFALTMTGRAFFRKGCRASLYVQPMPMRRHQLLGVRQ